MCPFLRTSILKSPLDKKNFSNHSKKIWPVEEYQHIVNILRKYLPVNYLNNTMQELECKIHLLLSCFDFQIYVNLVSYQIQVWKSWNKFLFKIILMFHISNLNWVLYSWNASIHVVHENKFSSRTNKISVTPCW